MMGSLEEEEEERLLQMVYDFIESESSTKTNSTCSFSSSSSAHPRLSLGSTNRSLCNLGDILRKKTDWERRISERVGKHMRNKMDVEKSTDQMNKWLVECLKMDGLQASLCRTSWATTPGCPCGNYEYIEIVVEDEKEKSHRLIVDIEFKSQFEVARPTKGYTELSSKLPAVFVGREDKLKTIISLLCSAAEESLRERGLHIPPWRKPTYMHSKYWKFSNNNNCPNCHNKITKNVFPKNDSKGDFHPRFGKWVPPTVMIKGWRRDLGADSSLSNQFSNKGINCC